MSKVLANQSKVTAIDEILGVTIVHDVVAPTETAKGYAPGCIWVNKKGVADAQIYFNKGTKLSASWDIFRTSATSAIANRLVGVGASLTATVAAHDGKTLLLDTAAGSALTIPAATGSGARIRVKVSVTATGSHTITAAGGSHFTGFIFNMDQDGTAVGAYKADSTSTTTITLNHTTTGGIIGDSFELEDTQAGVWQVNGNITCVAGSNIATPLS